MIAEIEPSPKGSCPSPRMALRVATREAHAGLEENPCMRRLMASDVTLDDYAHVLRIFAAWHGPVEGLLSDLHQIDPDAGRRQCKALWLDADLTALAGQTTAVPPSLTIGAVTGLVRPEDVPSMLGMAYVVEGATLGGELIARHLSRSFGCQVPMRFFTAYGDQRSAMWQGFQLLLEKFIGDRAALDAAIGAANDTFRSLDQWLGRQSVTLFSEVAFHHE